MFQRLTLAFAKWRLARCTRLKSHYYAQLTDLMTETFRRGFMDSLDEFEATEFARLHQHYAERSSYWAKVIIVHSAVRGELRQECHPAADVFQKVGG